jgi:hypothetical protein
MLQTKSIPKTANRVLGWFPANCWFNDASVQSSPGTSLIVTADEDLNKKAFNGSAVFVSNRQEMKLLTRTDR